MRRMAHAPQGFPTDKVMKTVVRGQLNQEQIDLIRGVLTLEQEELDKDELAQVIAAVDERITVEAASILVSSWYDAGKNKIEWEEGELNHWIMAVLATKMSMNFKETTYDEDGTYNSVPKEGKMNRESMIASVVFANEVQNTIIEQIRSTINSQQKALLKAFGQPFAMYGVKKVGSDSVVMSYKSRGTENEIMAGFKMKYDSRSDTYVFTSFTTTLDGGEKWGRDSHDFYAEDLTDVSKLAYLFELAK